MMVGTGIIAIIIGVWLMYLDYNENQVLLWKTKRRKSINREIEFTKMSIDDSQK